MSAELIERLNSHMGKADVADLLRDCRLAADHIETLESSLARAEAALETGKQLANVAFNICQRGTADAGALRSLNAAQLQWDEALRAARLSHNGDR